MAKSSGNIGKKRPGPAQQKFGPDRPGPVHLDLRAQTVRPNLSSLRFTTLLRREQKSPGWVKENIPNALWNFSENKFYITIFYEYPALQHTRQFNMSLSHKGFSFSAPEMSQFNKNSYVPHVSSTQIRHFNTSLAHRKT